MMTHGRFVTAAVAGVLYWAASLSGQVVPSQDGRALDANPSLGQRYNDEASAGTSINSQLYVTGQVSGLGYFHGSTGSDAPGQLQSSLVPSSNLGRRGLSTFNSRSVGVAEALGGQSYLASPYYSRSQTVLGVNSIVTGRTLPGSNVPIAPAAPIPSASSFGRQLYVDALADFRMTEAARGARVLAPEAPQTLVGTGAGSALRMPPTGSSPIIATEPAYDTPVLGDLFGVRNARQRQDLARELYLQAHPDRVGVRREAEGQQDVMSVDGALPGRGATGQGQIAPAPPARQTDANAFTLGGLAGQVPGMTARNQDVFMDMLLTFRQARRGRELAARAAKNLPAPEAVPGMVMANVPGALVESLPGGNMVIHSLAGEGADLFNARMAQAGRQLRSSQYYEAAYTYETAGLHDQRNPLARLGKGLSLLGAGESLTAAYEIERAMQIFPPLAEAQVDLSAIMGAEALDAQLTNLDRRLTSASPEARQRLQFLATFLYFNSRQYDKAKSSAQKLITQIQADTLLRTYAQQVLDQTSPKAAEPETEEGEKPTEGTERSPTGETPGRP